MTKLLKEVLLVLIGLQVTRAEPIDEFIADIIGTWRLRLPTVVLGEDIIELCTSHERVLCLTNGMGLNDVAEHLAISHLNRTQDGVIFVGSDDHSQLIELLTMNAPTILRSNCPVFMPIKYSNEIRLRLDSNIIFYEELENSKYHLFDKFVVKDGLRRSLKLGSWNQHDGIKLERSINRWDRRDDLTGAIFVNSLRDNAHYARLMRDKDGKIVGSWGILQYMLGFVIVDKLNMTLETVEIPDGPWRMLENGSWTGGIGRLQRREADIVSVLMGMRAQRCSVIDCSAPTLRDTITLISAIPKGTAINMWVYLKVFGVIQWTLFFTLLVGCVIMMIFSKTLGIEEMEQSKLRIALEAIATAYLFTIQLGDHVSNRSLAVRLLLLTTSVLTLLMFVYYTTDITAEMTSGTPNIPIRTFEDVIHHDYKVIAASAYYGSILASSEPGTAKYEVYKEHLVHLGASEKGLKKIVAEPTTLMYASSLSAVPFFPEERTLTDQVVALNMDDSAHVMSAFGLQKDSEFLDLLNHYLLKEIEHGIIYRLKRRFYKALYVKEQFGMSEPQPLGYENVIFTFACLGVGMSTSLGIAMVELIARKFYSK